ncbi:MAG: metalloregulator ArsR/SmtB family transcription factor [bacterium]
MQPKVLRTNSKLLKSLGHAKRLEIICLLQCRELTVNQIADMSLLRQATVSQHLMLLKNLKLVSSHQLGKEIYYTLDPTQVGELASFLKTLSNSHPLEEAEPTVIDPVCHMHLTPSSAGYTATYNGVKHYFCGRGCLKEFHAHH